MKRTWAVRPDTGLELGDGRVLPCVSREALVEAYMDAAAVQDRLGGVVTIVCGRVETDVLGERVVNGLVFEWRDRAFRETRSGALRDASESPELPLLPAEDEADPVLNDDGSTRWEHEADPTPEELEARLVAEATDDNPDGFDTSKLEDEDVSSIPAEAR